MHARKTGALIRVSVMIQALAIDRGDRPLAYVGKIRLTAVSASLTSIRPVSESRPHEIQSAP